MGSRLEEKSALVRKRIENHSFDGEDGEEYQGSSFGGFSDYFRRKKIKLQNLDAELRAQSSDKPKIFKGVVCHVNGYTQPSLNDLHTIIVQHGGGFVQYLDGKTMVTHIIASNLTPKKKEEFKRYRIVKPAWIVDSVAAGKLLPWNFYRVIDEGVGQKTLGYDNGQMITQVSKTTQGYREQTDTSWYTDQLKKKDSTTPGSAQPRPIVPQTETPEEEIDDDEYPDLEITSSVERALEQSDATRAKAPAHTELHESIQPEDLQKMVKQVGTPPPSSPPQKGATTIDHKIRAREVDEDPDQLESRQGSQEPDYSMAIIRESDVLRSVSPSRLANMTAEEHNALLLSDPRIRKSTVVHPGFLEQYYRESRLHHLSTWKADLKSQLQSLAAEKSSSQKNKFKRLPGQRRYIMHVDFDSFFAAVSLKKYPQYKDKPAVVAHGGGSGSEIASCNYPAREFGISNGMWMRRAQELCPDIKILPYDFPAYEDASRKFYEAILAVDGVVQSVSIDEALIDISATCFSVTSSDGINGAEGAVDREQHKADQLAQKLRDEVLEKTGCAVSVGIGGNILLAKVALRKAKPAGQYQLRPEEALDFIGELEVQKLPGVAWSTGGKLEQLGIKFVKDIRGVSREKLINTLGPKTGEKLWDFSRGVDKSEVGDQVIRKSVSAEVNWGVRFENHEQVDTFMHSLCGELHTRLIKEQVKGKQLTIKIMRRAASAPRDPPKHLGHGKCDTFSKSLHLGVATNNALLMAKETIAMLKSFKISPGELRGIGVQMQKLDLIKNGLEGSKLVSQRKLQFKTGQSSRSAATTSAQKPDDPILDDVGSPQKQNRMIDTNKPISAFSPTGARNPSKKSLNTMGTQFLLPTQFDPSVLAELPDDIRQRLAKHVNTPAQTTANEALPAAQSPSSSKMPASQFPLPNESQLDPNILEALPDDVRAEILGYYKSPSKRGAQAVLPQSPRKNRTIPMNKQQIKRKRGGGLFAGRTRGDNSTLTQSNFVARPTIHLPQEDVATTTDTETDTEQLDPEFLAALPEDIRKEVINQQRQAGLQRTGGIETSLHQKRKQHRPKDIIQTKERPIERLFVLPSQPAKPTFTSRKLTELPDLRDAITAWYEAFSDEGPYQEDVSALMKYLSDVVSEERDLDKAVAIVKWMVWVVDENEPRVSEDVNRGWRVALDNIKQALQDAISKRRLPTVEFG
ncbi:Hypothetical protein R9X50_00322500 [Acrodontium crateriforme]|uniref:DNA repair protein REV1 n=1 Tax=Acrodontium crateriforme TaxID=150365 RepID=A0AAQ3M5C3_9PEZI|nr:Hypothetical protein R9X50_00322500 [Acrodontium crateriforme]